MFLRVSYRVGGGCILSHNNLSINIATVLIKSCGMTLLLLLNFSLPFRPLPSSRPIFVCLKQSKTVWQKPGRTRLINLHSSYSLQVIKLNNVGEDPLTWALDCAGVERLEDGTFKFVHPTGRPLTPPTPSSSQPTGEKLDSSNRAGVLSLLCSANQVLYRGTCTMLTCFVEKLLLW